MRWKREISFDRSYEVGINRINFPRANSVASREELRGISRGKDAKDVDWTKVAATIEEVEEEEKPAPIKISVDEVLNRVRKPQKKLVIKAAPSVAEKNGMFSNQYSLSK